MTAPGRGHTSDFAEVAAAESAWLAQRRGATGLPEPDGDVVGVALSGGGIRSASFNLGVLQALQRAGLMRHVDVLSTVSGGGFTGAAYTWLRATMEGRGDPFDAQTVDGRGTAVDWLRAHGRYLVAHAGFSVWTLAASILAATLLNVLVLAPPLLLALYGLTLGWLPLDWPGWVALPGGEGRHGHDGFLLLLLAGAGCLALFPVLAFVFALAAGVTRWRSMAVVLALRIRMGQVLMAAAVLLGLGAIPLATAAGEALLMQMQDEELSALSAHASWLASMLSGLAALLAGRNADSRWRARLGMLGVVLVVFGLLMLGYHLAVHAEVVRTASFAALFVLSLVLACVCDVNAVSMHAYYRARLADGFMPRTCGGRAADPATFALDEIGPATGAPLPLVNTTLNTVSARNRKESARGGENFTFSPLYAGCADTGWRDVSDYRSVMALSTAATVSGAAIDPDTYATRSRAVSALMALLNVRLGFWALNPASPPRQPRTRPWWWLFIAREMFGFGLDARRRHVHLSDGGHFDNLGLYELVRRRARWMLVFDAGADPQMLLADLGKVVERVRVDFGAEVELCADALRSGDAESWPERTWLLGTVRYADGSSADIVYLKAMMASGLSADIAAWSRAHPAFPNESTANQFFDEPQFEAYRVLGRSLVERLIGNVAPSDIAALFTQLRGGRSAAGATTADATEEGAHPPVASRATEPDRVPSRA